jgi:hypothetical protein
MTNGKLGVFAHPRVQTENILIFRRQLAYHDKKESKMLHKPTNVHVVHFLSLFGLVVQLDRVGPAWITIYVK